MAIDKASVRDWFRRVRDVLNNEWDPIGGCPENEYDTYAARVMSLLLEGKSDEDIEKYLEWVETVHMGLNGPVDRERLKRTTAAVRAAERSN
jgi:hypothetical protein